MNLLNQNVEYSSDLYNRLQFVYPTTPPQFSGSGQSFMNALATNIPAIKTNIITGAPALTPLFNGIQEIFAIFPGKQEALNTIILQSPASYYNALKGLGLNNQKQFVDITYYVLVTSFCQYSGSANVDLSGLACMNVVFYYLPL